MSEIEDFKWAVTKALRAAHGDSNDREIGALRSALADACLILDVDYEQLESEAYDWATEREERDDDD